MREAFKPVLTTTLWMDGLLGRRPEAAAAGSSGDVDHAGVSLGRRDDVNRAKLSPLRDGFWVHAKRASGSIFLVGHV